MYTLISSKYWKDSCWKIMLFSFLVKCMSYEDPKTCDIQYWNTLNKTNPKTKVSNLDKYLSQIKNPHKDEVFKPEVYDYPQMKWANTHHPNGFHNIAWGTNEPMRKLLGITQCNLS